jgi:hypothetical protein
MSIEGCCIFLIAFIVVCIWVIWVPLNILNFNFCHIYVNVHLPIFRKCYKYFLSFCELSFHSLFHFLCRSFSVWGNLVYLHPFLFPVLFLNFFLLLCWKGYKVAFTNVLRMYQIYHTWIQPLQHSLLSPTPTNSWNTGATFTFIYMYIQYFHLIHPPMTFPSPPSHWY